MGSAIALWKRNNMHQGPRHRGHPHFAPHHHVPPGHWRGGRRFFWPFAMFLGGVIFLSLLTIGIIIYLSGTWGAEHPHGRMPLPMLLCIVPIVFFVIASVVGNFTFRRFGRPMTQI